MAIENTKTNKTPIDDTQELERLLNEIRNQTAEKEKLEIDYNATATHSPSEFLANLKEAIDIEEKTRELNVEKNNLEENLKYGKEKNNAEKKARAEQEVKEWDMSQNPKEVVNRFITTYKLENRLPEKFYKLSDEQKLFVVQNLKKRVIDVVNADAETQYSDYLKNQVTQTVKRSGVLGKILGIFKQSKKNLGENLEKETKLQELRNQAFDELQNTEEGQAFIDQDLGLLTESIKDYRVYHDKSDNTVKHYYVDMMDIEHTTKDEELAIMHFNAVANTFRTMPYEWGQQKKTPGITSVIIKGQKRKYEEAKLAYEQARNEVFNIKAKRETEENQGKTLVEMGQLDGFIQQQQLSGTHPELEKELQALERDPGALEYLKTVKNATKNMTWARAGFITGGSLAKAGIKATAGVSILGLVGSAAVGGVVGGYKGEFKAKEELTKKKKNARYGETKTATGKISEDIFKLQKELELATKNDNKKEIKRITKSLKILEIQRTLDRKGEIGNTTDITRMTRRFNELTTELENSFINIDPKEKPEVREQRGKRLALLSASIEHAQGKIEKGEVNFGDAQSRLSNHFNFTLSLNRALVLRESLNKENNKDIQDRINHLITLRGESIQSRVEKNRTAFLKKQFRKGALIGAGFTTLGYVGRWVWEYAHEVHTSSIQETTQPVPEEINKAEEVIPETETPKVETPVVPKQPELKKIVIPPPEENELRIIPPNPNQVFDEHQNKAVDTIINEPKTPEETTPAPRVHKARLTYRRLILGKHRAKIIEDEKIKLDEQKSPLGPEDKIEQKQLIPKKEPGVSVSPKKEEPVIYKEPEIKNTEIPIEKREYYEEIPSHDGNGYNETSIPREDVGERTSNEVLKPIEVEPTGDNTPHEIEKITPENTEIKTPEENFHEIEKRPEILKEVTEVSKNIEDTDTQPIPRMEKIPAMPEKIILETPTPTHIDITDHRIPTTIHEIDHTELEIPKTETLEDEYIESVQKNIQTSIPTETHTDVIQTETQHTNTLQHEIGGENLLDTETLKQINEVYTHNIDHVFPDNTDAWESVKNNPADSIWKIQEDSKEYINLENTDNNLYNYLQKLSKITHLKPRSGTLILRAETNAEYIQRALREAAKMKALDLVKL